MAEPYTKIQNRIWDGLGRLKVSGNAHMVLSIIIRNTLCFHRNQHEISNNFLQNATGLNERCIRRAMQELESKGIIKIASPNCGSHPKTVRILTDNLCTYQNCPGHADKSGRDNPDKSGRDNPDKSGREEIKEEIKDKKEREKKNSSFSETEDDDAAYYESIKRKVY